nr:potassium channel subfamily K member 18-like [Biomphalaria glabrata]
MENGRENSSDLPAKSNESGAKKTRKGAKHSGKKSKPQAASLSHSKKTQGLGESPSHDGVPGQAEEATTESAVPQSPDTGATGDAPLKRQERFKSRSRSSSRSRFSGFFKRKKRSKSETDLGQMMKDKTENVQESPSCTDISQDKLKTNLKRVSPYHSFDSRVQPRDRLMNMTVRDAVKEQRLKRVHSAGRSPQRQKGNGESISNFEPVRVAPLEAAIPRQEKPPGSSSTLPRLSKASILSSDPERSAFYKYSSNPELKKPLQVLGGNVKPTDTFLASPADPGAYDSREDVGERDFEVEDFITGYASKLDQTFQGDAQNDGEDTKTLVNVSISSQDEDVVDSSKPVTIPVKNMDEQRKASLTKFLELRQHLPPSLTRYSSINESNASKDPLQGHSSKLHSSRIDPAGNVSGTSPTLPPLSSTVHSNTEPVNKLSSSVVTATAPSLSLNGANVEIPETSSTVSAIRPTSILLEDSAVDCSSLSSSPQINSMTSSFRSSDQGYAESDDDSSEENSAFSTPPEEAEYAHSNQLTATVLQKLLSPIKEKQNTQLNVRDSGFRGVERKIEDSKGDVAKGNSEVQTGQRYIPHGVRRSKSDVSARHKPYRRFFRNTSSPPVKPKLTSSELSSPGNTPTASLSGDFFSAVSASTLTGTESIGGLHEKHQETVKPELTFIPAMSPAAQLKYRRSFTPNRALRTASDMPSPADKAILIIPQELSTGSTAVSPASKVASSPSNLRKGILKSVSKDGSTLPFSNAEVDQKTVEPAKTIKGPDTKDIIQKKDIAIKELPDSYPDIEIVLGSYLDNKPFAVDTNTSKNVSSPTKDASPSLKGLPNDSILAIKATSPSIKRHEIVPPSPRVLTTVEEKEPVKALPLIPLFHGLEVGRHREPTSSNYSLAEYIQEQSLASRVTRKQGDPEPTKEVNHIKEVKGWRKSFKRKSKKERKDNKKEKKEEPRTNTAEAVNYTLRTADPSKYMIMIDKQIQTSTWLINSLTSKKTPKLKKRSQSMKKSKRRDSVVSDTFVPTDPPKYKEAYQRSSLGDLRKPVEAASLGIVRFAPGGATAPDRTNGILRPQPVVAGSSFASESIKPEPAQAHGSPKTKKLSLTAVILLKNRLARFREKKRKGKGAETLPSMEVVTSDFPSDTLVNMENEINLSKLEISKETDIIDDIFEPEFSLDYTKKHIRFEPLPNEPMQSEEPLPPLLPSSSRRLRQRRESTMRERKRKCIQYCKKFIAFLFSHIGLCSLVVAYTILGGFIFQSLEQKADGDVRETVTKTREKLVEQIVSLAAAFQRTEEGMDNLTAEVNKTIQEYQKFVQVQTKEKGWDGVEGTQEEGPWTFASALLYAITVTTTIGYGHVAPKTVEGRIVTIAYAVVGIPLTLLCLTNIGDVMATGFRLLYGKICCGVCCTIFKPRRRRLHVDIEKGLGHPLVTTEDEQPDKPKEVIHVPTSLCLLLIAAYICSGAMLFSSWEQWDYLSAAYFCFITLSTIGFGDIVPGMDNNAWAQEEKLVLCALYLVLGLSLIAMCFNLVQEDVKVKCRWLGMKLGLVEKPEAPI